MTVAAPREFSVEAIASVVTGVALVDGEELRDLMGFVVGQDPKVFWGLSVLPQIRGRVADWLVKSHPELGRLRHCPADQELTWYLAGLGLQETYEIVPNNR